ncbi:hypothetical protein [Streptomyces sp. WM6378]|uniref:hypothetical protein n=1 Tax=Streptomyces sp. WM6378 TaxID=1415557 RepID=UPI00131E36CB|nr:hypothetical protein [Streptomyces sp. WM6378]
MVGNPLGKSVGREGSSDGRTVGRDVGNPLGRLSDGVGVGLAGLLPAGPRGFSAPPPRVTAKAMAAIATTATTIATARKGALRRPPPGG